LIITITRDTKASDVRSSDIIVIDHDRDTVDFLVAYIQFKGIPVRGITDGKDAVEMINNSNPRAILINQTMPHVDVIELAITLKRSKRTRNIKVFIMSTDEMKAKNLLKVTNADDYLIKPFDLAALDTLISGV